ncbi:MAG: hypothetical protein GX157_07350 [Candidatus Cloacimonetes bacterium]|nr:hypothetical protein [Candidatus Cloacimonadota bacterium]
MELMVTAIDRDILRITLDYTDRTPEEIAAASRPRNEDRPHRDFRDGGSRGDRDFGGRRGGRSRGDDEWRKYAKQKSPVVEDNPFKDL